MTKSYTILTLDNNNQKRTDKDADNIVFRGGNRSDGWIEYLDTNCMFFPNCLIFLSNLKGGIHNLQNPPICK